MSHEKEIIYVALKIPAYLSKANNMHAFTSSNYDHALRCNYVLL